MPAVIQAKHISRWRNVNRAEYRLQSAKQLNFANGKPSVLRHIY
jgi:hypothetical protein